MDSNRVERSEIQGEQSDAFGIRTERILTENAWYSYLDHQKAWWMKFALGAAGTLGVIRVAVWWKRK